MAATHVSKVVQFTRPRVVHIGRPWVVHTARPRPVQTTRPSLVQYSPAGDIRQGEKAAKQRMASESASREIEMIRARYNAILEADLPPALRNLVPETVPDGDFARWIDENLMDIKRQIAVPQAFGGPTQPRKDLKPPEEKLLDRYDELNRIDQSEAQNFYNKYSEWLRPLLARRK
jgi:hypothetical protein